MFLWTLLNFIVPIEESKSHNIIFEWTFSLNIVHESYEPLLWFFLELENLVDQNIVQKNHLLCSTETRNSNVFVMTWIFICGWTIPLRLPHFILRRTAVF